jgi:hypothetical protein
MIEEQNRSAVLLLAHGTPDVLGEMAESLGGGRSRRKLSRSCNTVISRLAWARRRVRRLRR